MGTLLFLLSLSFNTKIDSGVVLVFIVCIFYTSLWILKKLSLMCSVSTKKIVYEGPIIDFLAKLLSKSLKNLSSPNFVLIL